MTATPEGESEEDEAQPIKGVSLPTIPLDEEEQDKQVQSKTEEESPSEDWLDELRESADEVDRDAEDQENGKQSEEAEEDLEPADIPDWLTEMGSGGEETQVSRSPEGLSSNRASEEVIESADISEQQQDLAVSEGMTSEEENLPVEDDDSLEPAEIPDWLNDLKSEQRETLARTGEKAPEVEGQGVEQQSAEKSREEEGPLLAEEPALEELPEWLQETIGATAEVEQLLERDETESGSDEPIDQPEETLTAEEESLPGKPRSGEAEVERTSSPEPVNPPEWLQDVGEDQEEGPPAEPAVAFSETPPETFEPPEWLRDLMEKEPPAEEEPSLFSTRGTFAAEESSGTPQPADIPHWLRDLRPSEVEQEETPEAPPETEGLLKGLRGLIPASPGIEAPARYQLQSTIGTSEASRARAELLQSLLGQPHSRPRPELKEKESNVGRRVERWVVTVVLLVSVVGTLLAPLFINEPPRLTQPAATSGVTQLHEIVDGLDATDTVLVAFDYGPPEADELNRVAQPILEHLIDSGGRLSIVSTRPDAPPVAAALMGEVADSSDQYTLLGYRPGAGTAVSHLLAAVDEPPALLLILASRPGPLLRWIEQVEARYGDQIRVATASSALLEPVTSPYLDTNAGQLSAAVHGLAGAASYESLRGEQGEATRQLDTLATGHIAIVVLMIVGAAVHGIGGDQRGGD